jgi:hypothetical protein
MISIIQGCGSKSEDVEPVKLIEVRPESGGKQYLRHGEGQGEIFFLFSTKPKQVIVNDVIMPEAIYFYYGFIERVEGYAVFCNVSHFISKLGPIQFIVTWTDNAGEKSSIILQYEVVKWCCPPELVSTNPDNKAIDVDATQLNKEGIRFLFSESIFVEEMILHITADNKTLQWKASQDPTDQDLVVLYPLPGNELGFNQEVVVRLEKVMDLAGNLCESENMPDGTLELNFTTAK